MVNKKVCAGNLVRGSGTKGHRDTGTICAPIASSKLREGCELSRLVGDGSVG